MRIVRTRNELETARDSTRGTLGFVPTMGNLHAGHLKLVEAARTRTERVAVSIFVNPLQFGENEDYGSYPRTLDADHAALEALGVDLVFTPDVSVMYPEGEVAADRVRVPPPLADTLEGAHRPGHFDGVATVVERLFESVRPDLAVFGEKDYQQLLVIRWLVAELGLPVEILGVATAREADGLALSSRNQYLEPGERERAPEIYRALVECGEALQDGATDYAALEAAGQARLSDAGLEVDYFAIRGADDLSVPGPGKPLVALVAARLGRARLIDNLVISRA